MSIWGGFSNINARKQHHLIKCKDLSSLKKPKIAPATTIFEKLHWALQKIQRQQSHFVKGRKSSWKKRENPAWIFRVFFYLPFQSFCYTNEIISVELVRANNWKDERASRMEALRAAQSPDFTVVVVRLSSCRGERLTWILAHELPKLGLFSCKSRIYVGKRGQKTFVLH